MSGGGSRGPARKRRQLAQGFVDEKLRPLLTLHVGRKTIVCLVDTGFNGELLVDEVIAREIGVRSAPLFGPSDDVLRTAGADVPVRLGTLDLDFDGRHATAVTIKLGSALFDRGDAFGPVAAIGSALLKQRSAALMIDFGSSDVTVVAND